MRTAIESLTPTVGVRAACEAFDFPRSSFYRKGFSGVVSPAVAARFVPRALDSAEREAVLASLHEERFQDSAPAAVYATLLDEGRYHCSIRTMYRILESEGEARERRDQLVHPAYIKPELLATGPCDFVANVAAPLPLKIINDMMGIPDDQYDMVLANSNIILSGADPEFLSEDMDQAVIKLLGAGQALAELVTSLAAERAQAPADDLVSALVTANIDGEQLTSAELASFFILLVVAGNETTRTALSHALMLFTEYPDQRALLLADMDGLIDSAVEEVVRYASPVVFMRRTLTRDYTMNGQDYRKDDKAVLYYYSANRDEAVFEDPERFDITRSPNPHVGFGGPGRHYCLGAHLARRELKVMLRELLTRVPDITAGEPDRLLSSFVNGIKRLPCTFGG